MTRVRKRVAAVTLATAALVGTIAGPALAGKPPWYYYTAFTQLRVCNLVGGENVAVDAWSDYKCEFDYQSRVWELYYRR